MRIGKAMRSYRTADLNIIAENAVRRLSMWRKHARIPIQGLEHKTSGILHGWVSLQITSRDNNTTYNIDALIMATIVSSMPARMLNKYQYISFLSLDLADQQFYMPASIDMCIIGKRQIFWEKELPCYTNSVPIGWFAASR